MGYSINVLNKVATNAKGSNICAFVERTVASFLHVCVASFLHLVFTIMQVPEGTDMQKDKSFNQKICVSKFLPIGRIEYLVKFNKFLSNS